MSNIFTWDAQDIDLKDTIKLKTNCQQSDTMVLQFNVYDYDNPVDLTNYNITFIAKKPDGTPYGQAENITKSNNFIKITCDSQLTAVTGRVVGTIVITDNNGNRKGSYFVILNVFGIITDEDRIVSKNFVDILNRFDEDVAIALSLSGSFTSDIEKAKTIADDFAIKIPQATSVNTTLNTTINTATPLESKLANDILVGTPLNAKLESNIDSANTVKSELVLGTATANTNKDALVSIIENAEQTKLNLQSFDPNSVVSNTNTMLNEMYCTEELLTINHGLNGYPIVKMTYTEYGAGIGGAGDFPAGADSQCNLMQDKMIYIDSNNVKILVPKDYYIANPSINKVNDYKYIVTFLNSTRSILIELIKGDIQNQVNNINNDLNYQDAKGTANEIILTISNILTNGYSLTFIAKANNNGSSTTINGKPLYKPNTTTAPNIIVGKAYTVWYNSTGGCFFIKASAEGDTIESNVLAGKKFSNDNDTGLIGTMPNNGALNSTISTAGGTYTIPLGYTSGGIITAPSLASITSEGTVTNNNQLLDGYKCISNGILYTGNIPSKTTQNYKPTTTNQVISAGQYLSEDQIILGYSDLVSENIVKDKVIGDIIGTATINSLGGVRFISSSVTIPTHVSYVDVNLGFNPIVVLFGGNGGWMYTLCPSQGYFQGTWVNCETPSGDFSIQLQAITNGFRWNVNVYGGYSSPVNFSYYAFG